jgi:putative oxidoreductase
MVHLIREGEAMTNSGKGRTIGLWVLRILLGAALFASGGAKLAGAPAMVEMFEKVGVGQWFRILTGALEVSGSILLIPRLTFYGAALLLLVMAGAVTAHLTVLGGNPAPPLILLVLNVLTAWLTRTTWKKAQ